MWIIREGKMEEERKKERNKYKILDDKVKLNHYG